MTDWDVVDRLEREGFCSRYLCDNYSHELAGEDVLCRWCTGREA